MEETNSKLPAFANGFLNYLIAIRSLSRNYTRAIELTLKQFFIFINTYKLKDKYDDISEITEDDIRILRNSDIYSFIFHLQEENYKPGTRTLKTIHIKIFFDYMLNVKHAVFQQPFKKIHTEKTRRVHLPNYLSYQEAESLLKAYTNSDKPEDIRIYCMLALFLNCGLRLAELANLKISDFNINNGTFTIYGKGDKERTGYLNNLTKNALLKYLEVRKNIKPENEKDNVYLFLDGKSKKAITRHSIWYSVKQAYNKAGLGNKRYGVHTLRHTCATLLYRAGIPIKTIQELLGHTKIDTTQIYTHLYDKEVIEAMMGHPLSQFKMKDALAY